MNKNINKKNLVIIILLCGLFSVFLTYNKGSNKVTLEQIKEDAKVDRKQFAMYIKNIGEIDYREYNDEDNMFPSGYKLNVDRSECQDNNGTPVDKINVVSQTSDGKVMVTSTKTIYCTFYFDKSSMSGSDLAQSGSKGLTATPGKGDLTYRYVGTAENEPNNYICFGTTDKESCKATDSEFKYRIIGITSDGKLKIIKNKAMLNTKWNNDTGINVNWNNSSLNKDLNSTGFVDNTTYVPSGWKSKISEVTWNIGDSKWDAGNGYGNGYTDTGDNVWNWESRTKSTMSNIGLMYLSDYYYSLDGPGSLNCYDNSNDYGKCKTSWLHLSNSEISAQSNYNEWTIARYGLISNVYYAWAISSDGHVYWDSFNDTIAIRPVFYLTANSKIISGTGKSDDPYMLESPEETGTRLAQEKFNGKIPSGFNTTPVADLYRFVGICNAAENGCDNVVDNFICFGSSSCSGEESDNYLYRIIGITSEGKLKLIKNVANNTSIQWNTEKSGYVKWDSVNSSYLYTSLNSSGFLTSTSPEYIPANYESKITSQKWNTGDVQQNGVGYTDTGDNIWKLESKVPSSGNYKIGLMYLSDYYYSLDGTGNINCITNYMQCQESWMTIGNNGKVNNLNEWTMIRSGGGNNGIRSEVWMVQSNGGIVSSWVYGTNATRPVFYLTPETTISSGSGKVDDPFIISLS